MTGTCQECKRDFVGECYEKDGYIFCNEDCANNYG